jgi:plasmid maintenance system antidote protein VapI
MPTVDQVRRTVARALEKAGEGPVELAGALGIERNYIRDFLEGRKDSLRTEVMLDLSERFGIPFKDLVVTGEKVKKRGA